MMAAQSNLALPRHTDDVPVITAEFLEQLRDDLSCQEVLSHIALSQTPDVFKTTDNAYGYDVTNFDIKIWRRELPEKVQAFVACALEVFGTNATQYMPKQLSLNSDGKLAHDNGDEITQDYITLAYAERGVDRELAEAFAEHFIHSAMQVLLHSPKGTSLSSSNIAENARYDDWPMPIVKPHTDKLNNLAFHYSDPGTPYPFGEALGRTQAGDVSMHGKNVWHGFATSKSDVDGSERPRFFLGYKVLPAAPRRG